jgi:hypothetical protein
MLPQNVKIMKQYVFLVMRKRSSAVIQDGILVAMGQLMASISKLVRILSVALTCCRITCPV